MAEELTRRGPDVPAPGVGAWEVLVTDPIDEKGLAALLSHPRFKVHYRPPAAEFDDLLSRAAAWLVRSETKVSEAALAKAPRLKVVGRAGVGVDNIDVPAASRRGILVMNVPGANTLAAAEHAFALLLAVSRNVPQAHADMAAGRWERARWVGSELSGKTLGIVGLGRIGREVARRAQAFNMTVLAFDPFVSAEFAGKMGIALRDLKGLLTESDYVTLHASLTGTTKQLLDRESLGWVKPGARLVNCARGELIDDAALVSALESGRLRGAALDVFVNEPLPADSPLRKAKNLILTPHLGASTEEAQERVASDLVRDVIDYFESGTVRAAVNLPGFDSEILEAAGPWLQLSERLGRFASQLLEGGILEVQAHCEGPFEPNQRHPIAVAAVKGLLSGILDERGISWINAPILASERGIRVLESADLKSPEGFGRLLTVGIRTEGATSRVSGTVFPDGSPRLVRFGTLALDVPLEGRMIVLVNQDRPGMIGKVGTLLGRHQVNIADMRVGRKAPGSNAAMVITVDDALPPAALEELKALPGIEKVHCVSL